MFTITTHAMNKYAYKNEQSGIALLITLLIMTVLLGVSASLLNITLKQLQFANIGLASEMAFQAANAGMECMLYQDYENYPTSKFDVGEPRPWVACMGEPEYGSGSTVSDTGKVSHQYAFTWGWPELCSDITIYKFYDPVNAVDMETELGRPGTCPIGVTCTIIRARGYNVGCANITTARTIERELTQKY